MPPKVQLIDVGLLYDKCFDLDKDYMPYTLNSEFNLEVTISFDHKRHTKASAYLAQEKIIQYLCSWHNVSDIVCVIEYQKNGFPHYHLNIGSDIPFPDGWSFNVMRAFERYYGFTSCKPIVDYDKWLDYLWKDVVRNNIEKPLCPHYCFYSLN